MQDATRHYINGGWVASIDGRVGISGATQSDRGDLLFG